MRPFKMSALVFIHIYIYYIYDEKIQKSFFIFLFMSFDLINVHMGY